MSLGVALFFGLGVAFVAELGLDLTGVLFCEGLTSLLTRFDGEMFLFVDAADEVLAFLMPTTTVIFLGNDGRLLG